MLRFLSDTDRLTLFDRGHPLIHQRRAAQPAGSVGVSAVTVQEQFRGRLAALARHRSGPNHVRAYASLVAGLHLFAQFPVVAYDDLCDQQFAQLRGAGLRVGTMDLKIAAAALVKRLVVLTRNRRDFGRVPGLALDDWSVGSPH